MYIQSNWIEVNLNIARVFSVKLAEKRWEYYLNLVTTDNINLKILAFQEYGCLSWVMQWGECIMKMWTTQVNCICDEAMHSLF